MKQLISDIFYVWIREIRTVFSDKALILFFLIVPLGYPIIYSYIYNNETVRNVEVIVVDRSQTALSREFKRKLDASPEIKVVGYTANMEEAKEAMRRKEAYGIVYLPSDFSKNIHTQKQATVSIFSDMSSLLFYKAIVLNTTEVSLDIGADIRVEEMGSRGREEDLTARQTIKDKWISLYNPQNGFASFLIPAILVMIIQQTLILGIATLVGTHNDEKRFALATHSRSGVSVGTFSLTIGKGLCYVFVYLFVSVWVLRVIPYLFRLPQIGDPLTIAAFVVPLLLACTFFAMTLSYLCSQREFALLLFVFTSVLFLFLSGISWPWTAMPEPLKAIAYIIPSTAGIHGFVKINSMGASLADIRQEYILLWIEAGVYCVTAMLMHKWWIKNYNS